MDSPDTTPAPVAQPHVVTCTDCGHEVIYWQSPGGDPTPPPPEECPVCGHPLLDVREGNAPMPDRPVYRCSNCDSVYHEPSDRCPRCGGPAPASVDGSPGGEGEAAPRGTGVSAAPPTSPPPDRPPSATPAKAARPRSAGRRRGKT